METPKEYISRMHFSSSTIVRSAALTLLFPLVLAGCGKATQQVTCTQQYWNGTIGMCLPQGWELMAKERLDQLGVPGDVIAAFQLTTPVSGIYPNVTVTSEQLPQAMPSETYSKNSIRAVTSLPQYQLIDTRPISVDGDNVDIHIYSAQPSADQPQARFYQVSAVSAGNGYTVTAYTPLTLSTNLESQILLMLQSLTFKETPTK